MNANHKIEFSTITSPGSLRKLIIQDGLQSGDRLPSERELAQRLGIGRPAIREAIKTLNGLGILESRPGAGTYVKSVSTMSLNWPEAKNVNPNFDLLDLFEIRKMIEPQAAALCATRASSQQIDELEQHLLMQESDPYNREIVAKTDYLFHDVIIRSCRNTILNDITDYLSPLLVHSRQITASTALDFSKMVTEHRAIFEAIQHSQPDLAAHAMTGHLYTVGLDLIMARINMTTSIT